MAQGWFGEARRHSEAAVKGKGGHSAPAERLLSRGRKGNFRLTNGFVLRNAQDFGMREYEAIQNVVPKLMAEGITGAGYDKGYDVFFFRGENAAAKDIREGYVLSVTDAKTGSISSIYEPPNF